MSLISIAIPALIPKPHEKISDVFRDFFQVSSSDDVEYYQLVPVNPDKIEECPNLVVKFKNSDLSLANLESLLQENRNLQNHLEKSKETIRTLSYECNKIFSNPSAYKEIDQKALKKAKKIKQLDEDNKKLRQLLKTQLENSEKLRLETQTTVETLREEFEILVKELSNFQRKSADPHAAGGATRQMNSQQPTHQSIEKISLNDPRVKGEQHSNIGGST